MSSMILMFLSIRDGDTYARYLVRMEEMRQSLRIVEQALNKLPLDQCAAITASMCPRRAPRLGVTMEAVIHHFKLWTEGFYAAGGLGIFRR